jgi:16S rRNA (uracil1498-N3)-methyltransferase
VRLSRVFVAMPLERGARVTLTGDAAGHVTRVLRLRPGAPLTLFNGTGGEYPGTIEAVHARALTVMVGEAQRIERESPLQVTLAQGVARGERMDLVVQKATELGVSRIVPLSTARSIVRLDGHKAARRLEHWRAISIGACEQSGRNRPPQLTSPMTLEELLREEQTGTRLLLSPGAALRLPQIARPEGGVLVLIGPEGGLAEEEQQRALAAGFVGVRIGPRVLRTETAAIAALVLLQREFGDL